MKPVEIVLDDYGRVIFGKCPCAFFEENLLARGPCEHMIAVHRASEPLRLDLPSSLAATDDALLKRQSNAGQDESESDDAADADDETESDIDDAGNPGKK